MVNGTLTHTVEIKNYHEGKKRVDDKFWTKIVTGGEKRPFKILRVTDNSNSTDFLKDFGKVGSGPSMLRINIIKNITWSKEASDKCTKMKDEMFENNHTDVGHLTDYSPRDTSHDWEEKSEVPGEK